MFNIGQLAHAIEKLSKGKLKSKFKNGAENKSVISFAPLEKATDQYVAFLAQSKWMPVAKESKAGVLILTPQAYEEMYLQGTDRALLICSNPYAWFAYALQVATMAKPCAGRIDPSAHVAASAKIAPSAIIEAGVCVGEGASVGEHTHLYPNVTIGDRVSIGDDCIIYANVSVYHDCLIRNRVILHSGCVIGADGFGFAPFEGEWVKIPQIGAVELCDDVEIGANTTVDRGALDNTVIHTGTKLDNQIQIGHNVIVGEHTVMAACTGVAGSARIGSHVMVGGGAGINGHITIPDNVQIGPSTLVAKWEEGAKTMMGYFPSQERRAFEKTAVLVRRIGEMRQQIKTLQSEIESLKKSQESI